MAGIRETCVAVGLVVAVLTAPAPAQAADSAQARGGHPQAAPSVTGGWRLRMLAEVNATRRAAGVPALALCPRLNRVAEARARAMAASDTFGHLDREGRTPADRMTAGGYRWTLAGENIAANQRRVPAVMAAWLDSPTHLATMTEARFTHVGFGHARDRSGPYRTLWVQDYGAGGRCS